LYTDDVKFWKGFRKKLASSIAEPGTANMRCRRQCLNFRYNRTGVCAFTVQYAWHCASNGPYSRLARPVEKPVVMSTSEQHAAC